MCPYPGLHGFQNTRKRTGLGLLAVYPFVNRSELCVSPHEVFPWGRSARKVCCDILRLSSRGGETSYGAIRCRDTLSTDCEHNSFKTDWFPERKILKVSCSLLVPGGSLPQASKDLSPFTNLTSATLWLFIGKICWLINLNRETIDFQFMTQNFSASWDMSSLRQLIILLKVESFPFLLLNLFLAFYMVVLGYFHQLYDFSSSE